MKVKVYFNLHKKLWSVLHMTPKGWRLHSHMENLLLDDVTWKVSKAGRRRVLEEGRKNVHAFAIGTLYMNTWALTQAEWHPVTYNPYKMEHFQINDPGKCGHGHPLYHSQQARFEKDRRVFACENDFGRYAEA